jgi:hypothetical protein
VIALVAASGVTGLGAALLPEGALCPAGATAADAAPAELRLEAAVPRAHTTTIPTTWGDPLVFRCFEAGDGVTCCVVVPR